MVDNVFPKSYHLLRPSDFQLTYKEGMKKHSRGFVLFRRFNGLDHPRLGLSVGRRFGGAVRRNRIKRLVREAVRLNWREWNAAGSDIVVVAKKGADGYGLGDVTTELSRFFLLAGKGHA
jgi:ribonuclease P protein component